MLHWKIFLLILIGFVSISFLAQYVVNLSFNQLNSCEEIFFYCNVSDFFPSLYEKWMRYIKQQIFILVFIFFNSLTTIWPHIFPQYILLVFNLYSIPEAFKNDPLEILCKKPSVVMIMRMMGFSSFKKLESGEVFSSLWIIIEVLEVLWSTSR